MAKKTELVYVDTSAFIAFLDRSDFYHSFFARLFNAPPKLITSPFVIAEGQGWFLKRYDNNRAMQFINFIESLDLEILNIDSITIKKTFEVLKKYSDQKITLADAMGLFVMKDKKIKTCWSTDRHLTLLGSELVINKE